MLPQAIFFLSYSISVIFGEESCVNAPSNCPETPYRSLDGSCNNLKNPTWGMANNRYGRFLPPKYGDGISTLAIAKSGKPLPGPRELSYTLYPDLNFTDKTLTLNTMQFGQIVSHDLSFTVLNGSQFVCCSSTGRMLNASAMPARCLSIPVPKDDPDYSKANIDCIPFLRTVTDLDKGCKNSNSEPIEQLSQVTSYIDLSFLYSNDEKVLDQIRKFQGGQLKTDYREGQYWPTESKNRPKDCRLALKNDVCFFGTDDRFNQNPQLVALEVLLYRDHNRIALKLSEMNPNWDDEKLFQEARKISIACYQNIVFYEWLPVLFGKDVLISENLVFYNQSYVDDYAEDVDAALPNEFSSAAYRHFHTAVAGQLYMMTEERQIDGKLRLSDWYQRSQSVELSENSLDDLVRGLNTQHQMAFDRYHDKEISLFLFGGAKPFGRDLLAVDIQRNRDHGVASYNDAREFCGLKKAVTFKDFKDVMPEKYIRLLQKFYEVPDDVDLYVGGTLESHPPKSLLGPTFLCIVLRTFHRSRTTDRFWFERSKEFTEPQLAEIKKASMSRLTCDNSKSIKKMQKNAFVIPGPGNRLVPCCDLPAVDLEKWRQN